ncbi:hypothetical protein [Neorhizobium petrolearium]|uniref:Uncharacterized protein n=1 Tax=Neorhizobium petrolearium TaxID=515361 RepID=A0ABY8LZM8_9HYPH|nr:hypothetical protein [Neorhizobium petrolearium]MCC2612649.1 hypothetical protein [Neorhizobium petrolearium]WGI67772.1 hypothetical protein QEO92_22750 [Neorhizobium petrolearium]
MPNKLVQAAAEGLPKITRRLFVGGAAAASLPVAAAAKAVMPQEPMTVDAFLKIATPAELVLYHSNALMDAMAAMHPEQEGWKVHVDHDYHFVLISGQLPTGGTGKAVRS